MGQCVMPYRVLSLDGGGSWALIEVRALIALYGEAASGHEVLRQFDLVAANSGGSLVLAGLVEDLKLGDLLALFLDKNKRRSIFSPTRQLGSELLVGLAGFGPKYSAEAKLPAIERLLPKTGNKPLPQAAGGVVGPAGRPVHLLIVGFDYDRNRATFFRSQPTGGPAWGDGAPATVTLAAAVHASTNAPILYFDAPAEIPFDPDRFWDGAISGCNNPVLAAVVEAITLGASPGEIRALSLGSGSVQLPLAAAGAPASPFTAPRLDPTLPRDLGKLAGAILDDPPDAATFIAHAVTGGSSGLAPPLVSRVVRLSPLVSPVSSGGALVAPSGWTAAQFRYLCNLGMDAVEANDVAYIDDWCRLWLGDHVANQPIRMDGATLRPEVGYGRFSEGMLAWQALFPPVATVQA
jgi:hypothetical protein